MRSSIQGIKKLVTTGCKLENSLDPVGAIGFVGGWRWELQFISLARSSAIACFAAVESLAPARSNTIYAATNKESFASLPKLIEYCFPLTGEK
ncbi:hypothetical protein K0M31_004254 [Melipona bicolor]|uniref:Uncharacterized protein n=1 Tax=Melipona bicolor TaxID=60889 RepID=A0AA40FWF7_9HYME|nr:hypothetical protein K0M31_004254 [Melipona bicolor]